VGYSCCCLFLRSVVIWGLAAGVTWTSRTLNAPWAARGFHTSVIDAAGAIYVIGGGGGTDPNYIFFNDVWASTDGGACRTRAGGGRGVLGGTQGVLGGTTGVATSTPGVLKRVLHGYYTGTMEYPGVLLAYWGYSRGT
jgi:hypothetical protein